MTEVAIALPEDLQEFLDQSIRTGHFTGPSHLVATALYAFRDQTELENIKLTRLRKDIEVGIGEIERGEAVDWNLEELLAEMHASHQSAR